MIFHAETNEIPEALSRKLFQMLENVVTAAPEGGRP